MGPPAHPAGVRRQLVGIARPDYVPIYAEALAELAVDPAMIVSGDEGLAELSRAGGHALAEATGGVLVAMRPLVGATLCISTKPVGPLKGDAPALPTTDQP